MGILRTKGTYIKLLKKNGIRYGATPSGKKVSLQHLRTYQLINMIHENKLIIE